MKYLERDFQISKHHSERKRDNGLDDRFGQQNLTSSPILKHAIVFIENILTTHLMSKLNLNMPKSRLDDAEKPTINHFYKIDIILNMFFKVNRPQYHISTEVDYTIYLHGDISVPRNLAIWYTSRDTWGKELERDFQISQHHLY